MTYDEYIDQMVAYALTETPLTGADLERARRQIGLMMRQVERDARHAAYARIQQCANDVNNQRPDRI